MNSVQKDSVSFSQAAAGLGQHFLCLGFSMIVRCCEAAWAARPELKFTALAIRPLHYSWYKKISTYSKKYSRFFIKGNFVIFLCFRWHFWNTWEVLAIAAKVQNIVLINPTRRGAFKAPLNKHFLEGELSRKNLTFPKTLCGCFSFPCWWWQFLDHKIFWG